MDVAALYAWPCKHSQQLRMKSREKFVKRLRSIVSEGLNHTSIANGELTSNSSSHTFPQTDNLTEAISSLSADRLQVQLPAVGSPLRYAIYFHKVASDAEFEAGLFGFRGAADNIPFHDHFGMWGFMKPLRGRVAITSYSWLPEEEEADLRRQEAESNKSSDAEHRPARFEGRRVLGPSSDTAMLEPLKRNVHRVEAADDGAVFFDLLIPGYKQRDCTYYTEEEGKTAPVEGEVYWLKQIPTPSDLIMGTL